MTNAATQLLATFDSLPPQEQHEVVTALLQRCGELPDRMLHEDELVGLADELFQTLDAEESNADAPKSR
ncbi:MAG: hypothetical protein U0929_13705 [Planctomycetaceae bacterium]